jgi:hypothetical protein
VAIVFWAMEALDLALQELPASSKLEVRRFSDDGAVVVNGTIASVFIGGTLIGTFDEGDDDRGPRNVLVVTLAKSGQIHLGRLARAFGLDDEYVRRLRRKEEAGGFGAVLGKRQGKNSTVSPELRAAWFAMFDAGQTPKNAHREQPRKGRHSYSTAWRIHDEWKRTRTRATEPTKPVLLEEPEHPSEGQLTLWHTATAGAAAEDLVMPDETSTEIVPMTAQPIRGGKMIQHAGSWMLLALAGELGLHEEAQHAFENRNRDGLRIALDAVICALAIKQFVVEGVRRLATPTGPALLRAERVPTPSGIRKLLGRLIEQTDGGSALDARMAARFIAAARSDDGPAVFYIDNHMRPYTGEHVVRKGWRMQDRRVLPGTSDYYVHDEDGRPVFRVAVTSHDSLTTWLPSLAKRLREALGEDAEIVLAFDRAGAFAEPLADLRDAGFDFVTYERKPYPELPASAFSPTTIAGDKVGLHESRLRNLGTGRGRIRRIAIRTEDGRQVNFLASSKLPATQLVEILWHRWRQENGFKHGVERWGINQLDGRSVESYPPGTIIPNPRRRRLDRALRLARVAEGDARRDLARFAPTDKGHAAAEVDLSDALERQHRLEDLRPWVPSHAPVEETELAGKLVRHDGKLKTIIDVIRVVCANAESDLASMLAPHLHRPREAKKLVANLLAAPGNVAVTNEAVHIRLAPAATLSERQAIQHLCTAINERRLTLPGDPKRLPLRFSLQLQ